MNKFLFSTIGVILLASLTVLLACEAPEKFEVSSLDIEPTEVITGETIAITARVKNNGSRQGTYSAILTVDGVPVETKDIIVAAGATETVTFSLVKDTPGTYEIAVAELSSTLIVTDYEHKTFNVGLKIVDFEYNHPNGEKEMVTAAIWYPTEEEPQPYIYHTEKDYESRVALDAPIAKKGGPYPLILFAHGAYGSGYNSAFFMEYLASYGYITVAPDFMDTKPPDYEQQIAFSRIKEGNVGHSLRVLRIAGQFVEDMSENHDLLYSYLAEHRLKHTSFVIDEMLELNMNADSIFYQAINEEAIGICGHSLGGLTVLGKVGAHPDEEHKDNRIRAALVFSAPAFPFEDTAKYIDVPIMLMAGDDDSPALHPELPRRTIYDEAKPPKYYLILTSATHFAFGNRGCDQTPLYQAVESDPQVNAVCRYGLAFFEKYLLGNLSAGGQLEESDSAWAYYIKEEKPGESFEWGSEPAPGTGGPGGIRKELRK